MQVSRSIDKNVRQSKIEKLLKANGVSRNEDEKELELSAWLAKIVNENRANEDDVNAALWLDLLNGQRRLIRCYELRATRKIKYEQDWQKFINVFQIPGLNFNNIIKTYLSGNDEVKVAAMETEINNGVIDEVKMLFVYNMTVIRKEDNILTNVSSYIPVYINIPNKTMMVKIWNRDNAIEEDKPSKQMDCIVQKLQATIDIETKKRAVDPQTVLYRMSKALFDEFFKNLPNYDDVENKKACIPTIIDSILRDIKLNNITNENGLLSIDNGIIDLNDEVFKLIQQAALYDYLEDHEIMALLKNTDRYISRIRFSDRDNLTASLTSETGVKCIFDAKTFMCVRNSLDLVEKIVSIVVTFVNYSGRGLFSVKYDASNAEYLCIHILDNRYYSDEDYNMIWELYKAYECENTDAINAICEDDKAQAV